MEPSEAQDQDVHVSENAEQTDPLALKKVADELVENLTGDETKDESPADPNTENQGETSEANIETPTNITEPIDMDEDPNDAIPLSNPETPVFPTEVGGTKTSETLTYFLQLPDPVDVEAALNSLMKNKTLPVEQMRAPVLQLISRKKLDAVMDSDYDLAENYDKAADLLQQSEADTLFERSERIRKLTLDDRTTDIHERVARTRERYAQRLDNLKSERFQAIKELEVKHDQEKEQFKMKWQNPAFLAKYNKPSAELLQLRFIEQKMAISKCYDEAAEKRKVADQQQKLEEKMIQMNMDEAMKRDFFKMKDQQAAEIQKTNSRYDTLERQLAFLEKREIEPLEYSIREMEIRKGQTPNRKLHTMPRSLMELNELDTDTALKAKKSPRTATKLAKFRNEKKGELKISPISDKAFKDLLAAYPIVRPQSKIKSQSASPSRRGRSFNRP